MHDSRPCDWRGRHKLSTQGIVSDVHHGVVAPLRERHNRHWSGMSLWSSQACQRCSVGRPRAGASFNLVQPLLMRLLRSELLGIITDAHCALSVASLQLGWDASIQTIRLGASRYARTSGNYPAVTDD